MSEGTPRKTDNKTNLRPRRAANVRKVARDSCHANLETCVAIFFACYRGHLGPSGPKSKKTSENGFPGPLGFGGRKSRKRVKKESPARTGHEQFSFFSANFFLLISYSGGGRNSCFPIFFPVSGRRNSRSSRRQGRKSKFDNFLTFWTLFRLFFGSFLVFFVPLFF